MSFNDLRRGPARAARRRRRLTIVISAAVVLLLGIGGAAWAVVHHRDTVQAEQEALLEAKKQEAAEAEKHAEDADPDPEPEPEKEAEPEPDWDIDTPSSYQVIVNKQRPFDPKDYEPDDLVMPDGIENTNAQPMRAKAAKALQKMHADASEAGVPFIIASAYRPYSMQVQLFDSYVARDGVEAAETYSARPGYSEHQTGLVADVDDGTGCLLEACFGETPAGTWLAKHAAEYGFVIRCPEGKQDITGYIYEPWHLRYVGTEVAKDLQQNDVETLEEYFGLDPAPTY